MPTITLKNGNKVELSQESYDNLAKAVKSKKWRAEHGGMYYYVDSYGDVWNSFDLKAKTDNWRYSQRNYFQTEEEAKHYKKRLEAIAEYKDLAEELNDGWEPNWRNNHEGKHYVCYSHFSEEFAPSYGGTYQLREPWHYLKSEELAKQVIDTLGEEKLKLVLDIKSVY
jgi:phage pi2 protein 07